MRVAERWWRGGGCAATALLALTCAGPVARAEEISEERLRQYEERLESLAREVERLRGELAAERAGPQSAGEAQGRAGRIAELADEVRGLKEKVPQVQVGGYGSVRFEESDAGGRNTTFNFRRFVLTTDAAIAPRIRSYLELEFERFRKLELERTAAAKAGGLEVEQAIEGTNGSELSLEQAWLQFDLSDALGLRAGGILVPLGRFNLRHDDNLWDLPRRSLVDRGVPVLPAASAWDELGAGVNGHVFLGETGALDYQLYVMNGVTLEPEVEEVLQSRGGGRDKLALEAELSTQTGTFDNDVKDAKALAGRLAFSPALGHEIAGSFYRGRYTPEFLPAENITAFALDGLTTFGFLEIEAEYVYSDFDDVAELARGFARRALEQSRSTPATASPELESEVEFELARLAESRQGYWVEARHDFRPGWLRRSLFGRPFDDPLLTAVIRLEQVWIDGLVRELDFADGEITAFAKSDRRIDRISIGGAYHPVPLVGFQLAYEYTQVNRGALAEVTNFLDTEDDSAHAVLVGATFGF